MKAYLFGNINGFKGFALAVFNNESYYPTRFTAHQSLILEQLNDQDYIRTGCSITIDNQIDLKTITWPILYEFPPVIAHYANRLIQRSFNNTGYKKRNGR